MYGMRDIRKESRQATNSTIHHCLVYEMNERLLFVESRKSAAATMRLQGCQGRMMIMMLPLMMRMMGWYDYDERDVVIERG